MFTVIEFMQVIVFAMQKHCFGKWCGGDEAEKRADNEEATCLKEEEDRF